MLPEEQLVITTNTNIFVAGESLYYKLYCFNTKTHSYSTISKIAHVLLVNDAKKIVFQQKIKLDKGSGFGDYYIPSNIITGNYKLVYYTNWMRNNKKNQFLILIFTLLVRSLKTPQITKI